MLESRPRRVEAFVDVVIADVGGGVVKLVHTSGASSRRRWPCASNRGLMINRTSEPDASTGENGPSSTAGSGRIHRRAHRTHRAYDGQ